jgi:iduronate 2-sulfatase
VKASLRLSLLACLSASSLAAAEPERYNVLLILADDLRPELGCYGDKAVHTPNIDALARQGTLFQRAYCQVAVCNPSRASMLSGLRPDTIGIFDQSKYLRTQNPSVVTLPQLFKDNGYRSLSVGKVFHHSSSEPGDDPLSWSEPMYGFGKPYRHWFNSDSNDAAKENKRGRGPAYEASDHPDDDYPDGKTAQKAIELLRENKDRPFFLGVGFIKPHLPFTCPQKYWDMYPADSIRLPENYAAPENVPSEALQSGYELRGYAGMPPKGEIPREDALNLIRGYRACTSFLDAQVGRVLAELDKLGLREKTIVVLWGDHGYHLGENSLWTKMTNFEIATRVPLIISVPGQKTAGEPCPALVESVDIFPTLAQLCGVVPPRELEGLSLAPLLADPIRPWKIAAFSQYGRGPTSKFDPAIHPMGRSIRTDRYRYTEWRDPKGALLGTELYDQKTDPADTANIAALPENSDLVKQLAASLQQGWKSALPNP